MCRVLALLSLILTACIPARSAQYPELPRVFIQTTYAPPTGGRTYAVRTGAEFQAALNSAQPGDIIELQAGETFTGPFTLPYKQSGNGWIYIRSSAYDRLPPPCSRVHPSDAASMPRIVVGAGYPGAIVTDSMAHHYRLVGIEVCPKPNTFVYNIVAIGKSERTAAGLPNNIVFDRCYIHGDSAAGSRRGILMNGAYVSVIDSHISDCKEQGFDSQAIGAYSSTGPFKIVNNRLEGAGENLMFGGADPTIPDAVPSDIEIRCNDFFEPLDWIGRQWSVKNLFELKNAQRVLIEGNRFENCWVNAQTGFALVLTPRNQGNTAPWSVVQDVVIRYNTIVNAAGGVNLLGHDSPNVSRRTARILLSDNFFRVNPVGTGLNGRLFQILSGATDVIIEHNTCFCSYAYVVADGTPVCDQFVFRNNIVTYAVYGFIGSGTSNALTTLDKYFSPTWEIAGNLIIGGSAQNFPPGSFFPANVAAVGFADTASGAYRLAAASGYHARATDGKDPGADFDSLAIASTYDCGSVSVVSDAVPSFSIDVCPVPASDHLLVRTTGMTGRPVAVALYNVLGVPVYTCDIGSGTAVIPTAALPDGLYLAVLRSGAASVMRRIIVSRH